MTAPDFISTDLKAALRRLKLSRMLDTLPDRLTLARQQKMPHADLLLLVLADEGSRGRVIARFDSATDPLDPKVTARIEAVLARPRVRP